MRRPTTSSTRGRRGFSLFELTLVLLIIGIAAAVVVPQTSSNIRSSALRTAANVLASDIDYCAGIAISNPNAAAAISFDGTNNKYSVVYVSSGSVLKHPMDSMDYTNDFATGRNAQLSGVTLNAITSGGAAATTLSFDSYGKPQGTGDFLVTLGYNGQTLNVRVSKETGDVTIE